MRAAPEAAAPRRPAWVERAEWEAPAQAQVEAVPAQVAQAVWAQAVWARAVWAQAERAQEEQAAR